MSLLRCQISSVSFTFCMIVEPYTVEGILNMKSRFKLHNDNILATSTNDNANICISDNDLLMDKVVGLSIAFAQYH